MSRYKEWHSAYVQAIISASQRYSSDPSKDSLRAVNHYANCLVANFADDLNTYSMDEIPDALKSKTVKTDGQPIK